MFSFNINIKNIVNSTIKNIIKIYLFQMIIVYLRSIRNNTTPLSDEKCRDPNHP
ncbi:hypothetical protein EZS27_017058 [termite gut metagenome]|uniref:Uncharacterized protein n=1 Tax=termite gut metagenome TaxID=433724 RepID=A0A5J4RKI4_9ZZZZ